MHKVCKRCKEDKKLTSFRKLKCRNGNRSDVCRYCYDNNQLKEIKRSPEQIESQRNKLIGRKYSLEHRIAISRGQQKAVKEGKNHFLRKKELGADHYRMRLEYRIWREKVLKRDGNKCTECGSTNKLHAHHKKCFYEYPDLRLDENNGKTLCISCHMRLHNRR